MNGKIQKICGGVLDACRDESKILPEDPAVGKALEDLKALYEEYLPAMEEIAVRFNNE